MEAFIMLALQIIMTAAGLLAATCACLSLFYSINDLSNRITQRCHRRCGPGQAIAVLVFLGWGIFFYSGASALLWFLPGGWANGEDMSLRGFLAGVTALALASLTVGQLEKFHRARIHAERNGE